MLAIEEHLLLQHAEMKSEVTRGSEVVENILEVSKLGTPAQKQRLLSAAAHVLRRLESLHIEVEFVASRKCVVALARRCMWLSTSDTRVLRPLKR